PAIAPQRTERVRGRTPVAMDLVRCTVGRPGPRSGSSAGNLGSLVARCCGPPPHRRGGPPPCPVAGLWCGRAHWRCDMPDHMTVNVAVNSPVVCEALREGASAIQLE